MEKKKIITTFKNSKHSNPYLNSPLITTSELAKLRIHNLSEEYLISNEKEKQKILNDLKNKKIKEQDIPKLLQSNEFKDKIGWFASSKDICNLFEYIYKNENSKVMLDVLSTGHGLTSDVHGKYKYVGGKIGTDYGILSINWLLITKKGTPICFSFIGNSPDPISYDELSPLFFNILSHPKIYER